MSAAAASAPVLEMVGVSVIRQGREIVRDVSLRIQVGEAVAVVGASGAGKSTLAGLAAGLIRPSQGQVKFRGGTMAAASGPAPSSPRVVQMIWQDPQRSLDPRQTVAEIIAEGLELDPGCAPARGHFWSRRRRAWREETAAAWLPRVGLGAELAERFPAALSGGQRQRVAIARALAVQPQLLVADEPTAALDPPTGLEILELLTSLQAGGLACLLITHQPAQAALFAQRVLVMEAGRVVEAGPAGEVLRAPRHPVTQALLTALPPWPPTPPD